MPDLPIWPSADYEGTEDRWQQMVSTWFEDGIVPFEGSGLFRPYGDSSGMFAKVAGDASAILRGFFLDAEDAVISLPIEAADSNPRQDRIVLRFTSGGASVTGGIYVKKGTPAASNPTLPSLTVSDTVLELPVGRVQVGAGVVTITAANVTDDRVFSHAKLSLPVGSVTMFYSNVIPKGWLAMNGQTVATASYPVLARFLGVSAATNMVIPDMSGMVPRGASSAVGAIGGADSVTLSTAQMPAHSHGFSGTWSGGNHGHQFTPTPHSHSVSDGGHNHGVNDPGHSHSVANGDYGARIVVTAPSSLRLGTAGTPGAANEVSWTNLNPNGTGIWLNASGANVGVNAASANGQVEASGTLSGSVSGTVASAGSGSAVDITPRHRQMMFIIKAA